MLETKFYPRYAERTDYSGVVLAQRLYDALARLNPDLPATALDDAFPQADPAGGSNGRSSKPCLPSHGRGRRNSRAPYRYRRSPGRVGVCN